jgi:hypothetical protein
MKVTITKRGVPLLNGKRGKKIGEGMYRRVYRIDRYVVKVSSCCHEHNENEYKNFARIPKRKRKYFATVFKYGEVDDFSYIVQLYVKINKKWDIKAENLVLDLEKKLNLRDMHDGNWTVDNNGNLKIFDLGAYNDES